MDRVRRLKITAAGLALLYLAYSALAVTLVARQATGHQHDGQHAAQHSTIACNLLCKTAAFIHVTERPLLQVARLVRNTPSVARDGVFHNLHVYTLYIRPPPSFLS